MKTKTWRIEEGAPYPMGVSLTEEGANFALFSIHAEKVELCLFDKERKPVWKCLRGAGRCFTALCRRSGQGSGMVFVFTDALMRRAARVSTRINC